MRAADFYNSIGVVTHSTYYDTSYGDNSGNNILPELQYLGITQIRDGLEVPATNGLIEHLMAAGIKDDMVAGTFGNGIPAETIPVYIANLEAFEAANPGGINSVEGFNEVSAANLGAAETFQSQLYAAIKADPKLSGISLYNYTGSSFEAGFYHLLGNVSAATDFGNTHSYVEYFPSELWNSWFVPLGLAGTPNAPYVVTETGFDTSGMPEDVTAKATLNDVLDLIHDGASKAYLYELMDERPDPGMTNSEDHFGQFNADGTPKPAATALHNLHAIIADTGAAAATFTPGPLSYSVTGLNSAPVDRAALQAAFGYGIFQSYITNLPAYGNSLLLAKSNGTFDLAVWQEPMIYDGVNRIAAPLTPVTVTFGKRVASVEVFDPLLGTTPIAAFTNVTSVALQITDHPLIVEIDPAAATALPVMALGSGPDVLALNISEDAYLGDAQFTVSVDGAQVGGLQTAVALNGAGASQVFDVLGAFASGPHVVSVNFLNDLWGGGPGLDRNLYVDSASLDGQAVDGAKLAELSSGAQHFVVEAVPSVVSIGSGPDTLALNVSEDSYNGDAEFTVSVDGIQVGGTQTAAALHATGASQVFDVLGAFASGSHVVSVDFLNDAWGGPGLDRNLYVNSASLDGQPVYGATLAELSGGPQAFLLEAVSPVVAIGSGPDTLALNVSEDAYKGDAEFTVSVDGLRIGGTQTAVAPHGAGASQVFDVQGTFTNGPHVVSVDFLNDAWGGSPGLDRNLYVNSASVDGQAITGAALTELSAGPQQIRFIYGTATATTLTLHLAEDAWQGDAEYAVSVDGEPLGGGAVMALNSQGQSQGISLKDVLSPGLHDVAISFLNDAYGGTAAADRNLYVKGIDVNGTAQAGSTASLYGAGTTHFQILVAAQ